MCTVQSSFCQIWPSDLHSFGVQSDQAQISGHAGAVPSRSRPCSGQDPDPKAVTDGRHPLNPAACVEKGPFFSGQSMVSAAGYLSLSNYGSGLLLPACWWVMERERWTGRRRVICGPGALSSAPAHLSCWGRGRQRRAGRGVRVRRAVRSWAENTLRLLPILRRFTLSFATVFGAATAGWCEIWQEPWRLLFFFPGQGCFCLCQTEERSDVLICWFHIEARTRQDVCVFSCPSEASEINITSPSRWPSCH